MGTEQSLPPDRTEFISLDNFYNGGPNNSQNIYQSRWSTSSSKQIVHKSISFTQSTQTINRYLVMLQSIGKKVECNNLYLPILCKVKTPQSICTDYKTLQLYYQHYDVRIKEEIEARKRHRQRFSEEEIWYIFYSILNGVKMFEKVGISSGSITTDSLRLNDKGHLKLINMLSWPDSQKPDRFYSPEELRAMRERIDKRIHPNIAETYSIAIMLLQLCTFIDGELFYNRVTQTLNEEMLHKAEQIVYRSYSRLLFNLLRAMLSAHYDRPLPSQIFSIFQPYEAYILKLQPFPFKVQKNSITLSNASLMSL